MDYASKHPGELSTGFNVHSDDQLAMERLEKMFNLKFKIIFHKGSAHARTSLLGKYIDFMIDNAGYFVGYVGQDKPLRILAHCWKERINWLEPDAPTMKEATGKEFVSSTYRAFLAPKGVPGDRLAKLRDSFQKAMQDPENIKECEKRGIPLGYLNGPETEELTYDYQKMCDEFWKKK